ncbi:MAG: hypothetical protein QXI87_04255 [Thermoproteota archaeon]
MVKLFSALFLGLFVSYAVYRALNPLDAFLSNLIGLGLMVSLPLTLILVFYGRLQWAKYVFTLIWVAYLTGMWIHMLVGMSATLPSYFWIPTVAILIGGIIFLTVLVKRGEISIPWLHYKNEEKLMMEEFKEGQEDLKGLEKPEESGHLEEDRELPILIESLNDIECKILLTLLESRGQYSKKELQQAVKTTYPRVLRAVDELSKIGLVEVNELPRRSRGAPIQHVVKVSMEILENEARVREFVKKRLIRLEEPEPQARTI